MKKYEKEKILIPNFVNHQQFLAHGLSGAPTNNGELIMEHPKDWNFVPGCSHDNSLFISGEPWW